MGTGSWQFTLVEETELELPAVPSQGVHPPQQPALADRAAEALIAVVEHLGLRGGGPEAWTVSSAGDPIGFLLEATTDSIVVWRGDTVLYRNRAAERLAAAEGGSAERRCLRFGRGDDRYLLEIIRER